MKFLTSALCLASMISAQHISIAYPVSGADIEAGSVARVKVVVQKSLTSTTPIALLVGLESCPTGTCGSPSDRLGKLLSTEVQSEDHSLDVTIPADTPTGTAQINVAFLILVGAASTPSLKTMSVPINVVESHARSQKYRRRIGAMRVDKDGPPHLSAFPSAGLTQSSSRNYYPITFSISIMRPTTLYSLALFLLSFLVNANLAVPLDARLVQDLGVRSIHNALDVRTNAVGAAPAPQAAGKGKGFGIYMCPYCGQRYWRKTTAVKCSSPRNPYGPCRPGLAPDSQG
ncbi:hypothetical protein C8J56DRAFT_1156658 [Mycena floridula]|nr:hypothetical protein C8J56DRAFT_1156658 [Mycena floridula]